MKYAEDRKLLLVLLAVLTAVVVGGSVDLYLDSPERWLSVHVIFELVLILTSLGLALYLWRGWVGAARDLEETREELSLRREERDAWRESARTFLDGLGHAIDRQFDQWQLTPAEREVAMLLIKGYSHKRIAHRTDRSERTARQHAVSVYRKAGLSGRAELAAYFLEDLMLPAQMEREGDDDSEDPRSAAGMT